MSRHPSLSVRAPEPTSIARLTAFRESEVKLFFSSLKTLVDKNGYTPSRIYNVDETAIPTVMPAKKVIAGKGMRQVGVVKSTERGQNTTAVCCCNAAGAFIPPQMIFARERVGESLKKGTPPGTVFAATGNGWATRETFVEWLKHFSKETGSTKQNRTLLILDGHASHVSLEALQVCEDNGIDVLTIPPHTSHKTQPLDLTVYGPLKTWYSEEVRCYLKRRPGQRVTLHEVGALFGKTYLRVASAEKAINEFRAAGIVPMNPEVFQPEDFIAASHFLADRVRSTDESTADSEGEDGGEIGGEDVGEDGGKDDGEDDGEDDGKDDGKDGRDQSGGRPRQHAEDQSGGRARQHAEDQSGGRARQHAEDQSGGPRPSTR